jgi:type IV secretion system protein VirB4
MLADRSPAFWEAAAAESPLSSFVAASSLVTPCDVITRSGDYLRTWQLEGVPFESASETTIAERHESMCNLLAVLGGGQFAIWRHRIQRRVSDRLDAPAGPSFAAAFDEAHAQRSCTAPFLRVDLDLTLLYRPKVGKLRAFERSQRSEQQIRDDQAAALAVMAERSLVVERMLRDLHPRLLGSYWSRGIEFSAVAEFLGYLINGEWRRVRVQPAPLYRSLPHARLSTGGEKLELRSSSGTRYAAAVDIQEFVDAVEPGTLNDLLYEDCEFIETQSFAPLARRDAMKALKYQRGRLIASEDVVQSQVEAMDHAMNDLGDGVFTIGEYHYSLMLLAPSIEEVKRRLAKAASAVSEATGLGLVPVDLVADAAWYAQQPGNFQWRTRNAKLSSRAFAALSADHNFAYGKRDGNPWGQAAMLLRTASGRPYYLNLHASPDREDSEDKKLPGNTIEIGVTGAGKTTLQLAILSQTNRWDPSPTIVIFDKDRGCEIYVRANRGRYFSLQAGEPTGLNPFQREERATPRHIRHCTNIVTQCLRHPTLPLLPSDERAIHEAVTAVCRMPVVHRRMSTIRQNLPRDGENSLYERLGRWCEGGEHAWVFDMADDRLGELDREKLIGFDYTEFLDDPDVRPVVMMDLLWVMQGLLDGRRLIYVMTEFWKAADDEHFAEFARNGQKTIRKLNGLGFFDTQSPSDVAQHPIGRTMVEQSVTKIALPNPDAVRKEYVEDFGFTDAEFEIIKGLRAQGGYRFLVKQNQQSVVCELDLSGLDEMLLVLSGSIDNVLLLDDIRARVGDDPDVWMPELLAAVRARKSTRRAA